MTGKMRIACSVLLLIAVICFGSCSDAPVPSVRPESIRIINTYRDEIGHAASNSLLLGDAPFRLGLEWTPADVPEETKSKVVWTSSAPFVLECSADGTVTVKSVGIAEVTASIDEDGSIISDSMEFQVFDRDSGGDQESNDLVFGYYQNDGIANGKVFVSEYKGDSKTVEIPSRIRFNGKACDVVCIGNSAFKGNKSIEHVILPDTVEVLEREAFSGCSFLEKVSVADGLAEIGYGCFQGCSNLLSFTVSQGVNSIGDYAFSSCPKLFEINNYSSFLDIDLENEDAKGVSSGRYFGGIAANAVRLNTDKACESDSCLIKKGKITYLKNDGGSLVAVKADTDSVELEFDPACVSVCEYAFRGLSALESVDLTGSQIASIGLGAFYSCSNLDDVVLNDGLETIGARAFCDCPGITSLVIPNTVIEISEAILDGCVNLESLSVPFIGKHADESNEEKYPLGYFFSSSEKSGFYEASQFNPLYSRNQERWNYFEAKRYIPLKLKSVSVTSASTLVFEAFENCASLENVNLNGSMTEIGEKAFRNCTGLRSIVIPESVGIFGSDLNQSYPQRNSFPFDGCFFDSITYRRTNSSASRGSYEYENGTLVIKAMPSSQNYQPQWWIDGLNQLIKNVEFDTGATPVTFIPKGCFMNSSCLESVTLPDTVVSIGDNAFSCCGLFGSFASEDPVSDPDCLVVPSHITTIGDEAFSFCTSLVKVDVPLSVTSIGSAAFGGCTSIGEISLPFVGVGGSSTGDSKYHFGRIFGANAGFKSDLTRETPQGSMTYHIPKSITSVTVLAGSIGQCAFSNCLDVEKVVLGDSVASIGWAAFQCCHSLESIALPASCVSVAERAFVGSPEFTAWNLKICLPVGAESVPAGFDGGWNIRKDAYNPDDLLYHPYYFYSENEPPGAVPDGGSGFWHYALQDGDEIEIWSVN